MNGDPNMFGEHSGEGNGELPGGAGPHERRQLLLDAFTKVAAERGYDQVSIDDVAAAAGLPKSTFFEYFDSLRQCLGAAYDAFFDRLADEARVACRAEESWPVGVRAAVIASLEFLLETASRARLFMVEGVAGGLPLLERRMELTRRLAGMLEDGRGVRGGDLPPSTEWILIGGVLAGVSELLLEEDRQALHRLQEELIILILAPYIGLDEAQRIAVG